MAAIATLRLQDQVAVVNGYSLPDPLTVGTVEKDRVRLIPNRESAVEWWLYADQHEVEIVAAASEPQPAPEPKPTRRPTRFVENVRLTSQGGGHWASSDGKWFVQREDGYTFCDAEHPMKLTPGLVQWAQANPYEGPAVEILAAHRQGKRGYLCPGNAEHIYDVWTVMTPDGWADDMGTSFSEAMDILRDAVRAKK